MQKHTHLHRHLCQGFIFTIEQHFQFNITQIWIHKNDSESKNMCTKAPSLEKKKPLKGQSCQSTLVTQQGNKILKRKRA